MKINLLMFHTKLREYIFSKGASKMVIQYFFIGLALLSGLTGAFNLIFGIYEVINRRLEKKHLRLGICFIACSMISIVFANVIYPKLLSEQQEKEAHLEKAITTYTFYEEGQTIDIKKIDLADYDITYKDSEHIAILKKKDNDSINNILPILTISLSLSTIILNCVIRNNSDA